MKFFQVKRIFSTLFVFFLLAASLLAQDLVVTFLDCGQGDAIVLQTPHKKTYLIDTGPSDEEFGGTFDAGEKVVVPYLTSKHLQSVDAVLISHPHLDHYGGTFAVLRGMKVQELVDAGTPTLSPPYLKLLKEVEILKINYRVVKEEDGLDWDPDLKVEVLGPPKEILQKRGKIDKNINDQSIVLKITHGGNTFLFPGDIEKRAENDLVEKLGHELRCKVLKAPHHGSKTSSTDEFLDAVNPQIAVISCGRRNKFHHPDPSVLQRLEERKISTYRTDKDGTVELTSDGKDISVKVLSAPTQ